MDTPKTTLFDERAFDDSFFAAYEAELAGIDVTEQASRALADALKITRDDGTHKSYEDIKEETVTFFANEWVRNDEALLNRMALEFAMACMGHNHDQELAQESQLRDIFEMGNQSLQQDNHNHTHGSHDHPTKEDSEIDPKTGKKSKKRLKLGWLWLNLEQ